MGVGAAQEWNFVEDVFLEPFEPEIDHWSYKQRDHLGEDQTADDD